MPREAETSVVRGGPTISPDQIQSCVELWYITYESWLWCMYCRGWFSFWYNRHKGIKTIFTMVSSLTTRLLVAAALLTKVGAFAPLQSVNSIQSVLKKSSSSSQLQMNMNLGAITGAVTGGLFAGSLHAIAGTLLWTFNDLYSYYSYYYC